MDHSGIKAIPSSPGCFACDPSLPGGLHLEFYFDGREACALFCPSGAFQGYEGILHGGIITTLLDEAMAKAVMGKGDLAVTGRLEVRLRRPANTDFSYKVRGWIEESKGRVFRTKAVLEAAVGESPDLFAEAEGVFFRREKGA